MVTHAFVYAMTVKTTSSNGMGVMDQLHSSIRAAVSASGRVSDVKPVTLTIIPISVA